MTARVWLVGTGPGQAQLLTRQAAAVIAEAEVLRHVEDCDPGILRLAARGADVGAYRGVEEILGLAELGRRVAVLYPGDPYIFGSGATLADRLARAGHDFDAIPGLLMETAAATIGGVPLSVEGRSASVMLGIGRGDSGAVRLAPGWWESGVRAVLDSGRSPQSPAAIITHPGESGQRRVTAALGNVVEAARRAGLEGQAVLLLGPGVELGDRLDTGARRPLHGRRVLITRARHEAGPLGKELSGLGASVLEAPTIEIRALPVGARFKAAVERLPLTRLLVFTTANAVTAFFEQLGSLDRDARHLHQCRVCAIGSETARALESRGVRPDMVADDYSAESLSRVLQGEELEGARVLVPRAEGARDALMGLLVRRGFRVDQLPVYRAVRPAGCRQQIMAHIDAGGIDVVTFTSSATAINFVSAFTNGELPTRLRETLVACMGPVTADTLSRIGMRVDIVAREFTIHGLAAAIAEALG
ncbi:MAG TPA: uroporphyrinogen-III synthase [Candidatus Nitrosotalea sp.]|nr:uroporphyrinogen-III synthase [Candidatus Nitrosotalea sp.]